MKKLYRICVCLLLLTVLLGSTIIDKTVNKIFAKNDKNIDEAKNQKRKPNIIMIVLDDYGWSDSSLYGSGFYETPNMERLAKKGVTFTNSYAGSNLCSPSRGMMLTGRYGPRNGVARLCSENDKAYAEDTNAQEMLNYNYNFDGQSYLMQPEPSFLPSSEITTAEQLKKAGYTTAHIGKWHLGNPDKGKGPLDQGFDINIGGSKLGQPPSYFSPYNLPNMENGPKGEYLTDRLTDEAVNFISDHKDEPFFLNLSHYAVHTPIQAKKELADKYKNKAPWHGQKNADYAAMIESADESIGRVMDIVEELGIAEDTIIVATSDNGGVHYWNVTSNYPLRKGKCFNYEGGIRVPTMISWQGHIEGGQVNDTPIHQVDYFPTFSELAGVELPDDRIIDGKSLVPLLIENKELEERSLFWYNPHFNPDIGAAMEMAVPTAAILQGKYKLIKNYAPPVYTDGSEYELYDLDADISELNNLAESMPDKVEQMSKDLDRWLYETNAVLPVKTSVSEVGEDGPVKIDQSTMKIEATSEAVNNKAVNAIDNNNSTYWQTAIEDGLPQSITIDLQKEYPINRISYTPTTGTATGNITQYQVYTSIDGINYNLRKKGTWENNNSLKLADFTATNARYVKLRIIDAVNGVASAAEINVYEGIKIDHVDPVELSTLKNMPVILPEKVEAVTIDGNIVQKDVKWDSDSSVEYDKVGIYEVKGVLTSENIEVQARIRVDEEPDELLSLKKIEADFDGIEEKYREISDLSGIEIENLFTVQFNVRLNGLNGKWQTLIEKYNSDYEGFRLDISPDGYLNLHVNDEVMEPEDRSHPWIALQSNEKIAVDQWTQIRFAYSSEYRKASLYVNNELVSEGLVKNPIKTIDNILTLGSNDEMYQLNGVMTDIKIYNNFIRNTSTDMQFIEEVKIDGKVFENFDPDILEYTYELDKSYEMTPEITVKTGDDMAIVTISPSVNVPGEVTITINFSNGVTKHYTIHFIHKVEIIKGDFNLDGIVDLSDLGIATSMYGNDNSQFDIDGDGVIGDYELNFIMDKILENN